MAKKMIRPLHSEADYDVALNEIERYFENEPKPGAPEADRFDLLALIIEDYERKRWPIEPPDTIDAIRYRITVTVHQTIVNSGSTTSRRPPALAFRLAAAFDFHRQLVLDGTHAEYDRIDVLKLSQCSVRS
ncbi:hypothetical protein KMZ29_26350 [Bradyrhizobium sediminis]|uniref:Uncharacterized protein n=1 Tax=Bradyrhizobium sediminis TaxID=2840469 RepID=A0A975NEP1_9BRAD|nr:hypothetical protein [Bradyrhizobium sediminis]QWG13146.1 hypothetical protein KMZ29_26350 [Bradyrhizobium sediminis]